MFQAIIAQSATTMAAANHVKNSAMEAGTISKHGASSKSLMSRANYLITVLCFVLLAFSSCDEKETNICGRNVEWYSPINTTIEVGQKLTVIGKVTPANKLEEAFVLESRNKDVATVASKVQGSEVIFEVTGVSPGTAIITITLTECQISKTVDVKVVEKGGFVYIGENGNWFINGNDTGVSATGSQGAPGKDGSVVTIGENGNWFVDGVDTGVRAVGNQGDPGKDGSVVTIGENGNWFINGVDTGVRAQGSVIAIGDNGNWFIDGIDQGVSATCTCGETPTRQFIITPPNKTEYENGEAFEIAGLKVHQSYEDCLIPINNFTLTLNGETLNNGEPILGNVGKNEIFVVVYGSIVASFYITIGIEMIFAQGGTFTMGSPEGVGNSSERPQREVTLSSFSIGKYEVTQEQWLSVMGSWPGNLPRSYGVGDNYPAYYVSWNDIVGTSSSAVGYVVNGVTYYQNGFCYKLSQLVGGGKQYRLPTEAEWEFAARGGSQSRGYTYSGSNTIGDVAWYLQNSSSSSKPVGTKSSNELGIHDMSGNVAEWCGDWWDDSYTSTAETNPTGPVSGSSRVRRGGGWSNDTANIRSASRNRNTPDTRAYDLGFRLAYSLE